MVNDHTGPETEDNDIDVSGVPSGDSNGSESHDVQGDHDDVTLDGKDPWKDLEGKAKAGVHLAEKTGALAYTEEVIKTQLVDAAMKIEGDMNTEGTEAYKLNYVWNELTPEGRSAFLAGNSLLWKVLKMAGKNAIPMLSIAQEAWGFFKRKTYKAQDLAISDFTPETVQVYCALGLLECSEAEAKQIDEMAAKALKVGAKGAKVLSLVALAIPGAEEFSPVFDKMAKGATLAEKPAEWAAKLMPQIRNEVKRRSVEVQATRMAQHNIAAADMGPEVPMAANGPMDDVKE